jgi:hypothetical protein
MAYDVSSWFVDQLFDNSSRPIRRYKIGTSDYSERVVKWPKFKRHSQELRDINVKIDLANEDGALNLFYDQTYNTIKPTISPTHAPWS